MLDSYGDAGHGGKDPGASDPKEEHLGDFYDTKEKDPNLRITLSMLAALRRSNLTVGASRYADTYVSLDERAREANNSGAKVFVSNHNNASTNSDANGLDVYYYPGSVEGERFARIMIEELMKIPGTRLRSGNPKTANFYVLRATKMPAILVEHGFVTNNADEARMNDPAWIETVGEAEARAICRYVNKPYKPKEGTLTLEELNQRLSDLEKDYKNFRKAIDGDPEAPEGTPERKGVHAMMVETAIKGAVEVARVMVNKAMDSIPVGPNELPEEEIKKIYEKVEEFVKATLEDASLGLKIKVGS